MTGSLQPIPRALKTLGAAILTTMVWAHGGVAVGQSDATDGYQVYQLNHKPAAEVQKVLAGLLREQTPPADLVVDPQGNRLLVRGPATVQRIAQQLIGSVDRPSAGPASPATPSSPTWPPLTGEQEPAAGGTFVALAHTRVERIESTFREVLGSKLRARQTRQPGISQYWILGPDGPLGELAIDRQRNGIVLFGSEPIVGQLRYLIQALDVPALAGRRVRIVAVRNADPTKIHQACEAYRSGYRESSETARPLERSFPTAPKPETAPKPTDQSRVFAHSGLEQVSYLFQPAGDSNVGPGPAMPADPRSGIPGVSDTPDRPGEELRDVGVDVDVEPLPDLDVIIVRGRERDVDEVARIIEEIERLSALAEPVIEIYPLRHVGGEQLVGLVQQVKEQLVGSRQGRVDVTPLVKPNALLLIGWGEAVKAVKELIGKLDRPVDATTESRVFQLKHAGALQIRETIQEFFSRSSGLGPEVQVTADMRTNSILVQASPRDMQEVALLLERLDTDQNAATTHARIFKLNNSLATDLADTLQAAIDTARGRTSTSRSAALELLTVDPQGQRLLRSGILNEMSVLPDPHTNTLIVSGPEDSMELIAALIDQLDTPAAIAHIKIYRIKNSDANALVLMLRSLLPSSTSSVSGPQLAGAEGESSLVPVRFAVEPRTNTIIATGSPGDLAIIEALILSLDAEEPSQRINKVYRLKNAPAWDVAQAISDFLRSEQQVQQAAPGSISPFQQIEREVVVVPEPISNALIMSATPRFFEEIEELIEELDAEPPQVIIQVLIAEVVLDNTDEFGVELGLQDSLLFDRSVISSNTLIPGFNFNNLSLGNASSATSLATSGHVGGQALSHFAMGRTNTDLGYGGLVLSASNESVSVLIRALKESRRLDVLSRPQIMTLDNQPAFIQVGKRVPRIVGSTIRNSSQVNTVTLENVGLILGVTPRISPDGMVVMEIDAEKSELDPDEGIPISVSQGQPIFSPVINLATAQTTVSAADGQTVVLGGMISKNISTNSRRVPFLSELPIVCHLFRFDSTSVIRSELLIILTPHVVRNREDADRIKQIETARIDWCLADVYEIHGPIDSQEDVVIYPDFNPRGELQGPTPADSQLPHEAPTPPFEPIEPFEQFSPRPTPFQEGSARPETPVELTRREPSATMPSPENGIHQIPNLPTPVPGQSPPFGSPPFSPSPGAPISPGAPMPSHQEAGLVAPAAFPQRDIRSRFTPLSTDPASRPSEISNGVQPASHADGLPAYYPYPGRNF